MTEVSWSSSAGVDAVWSVLADGFLYASWVVGASRVRAVDADWPTTGSRIHHSAGSWPVLIDDVTEVLACEPGRALTLQARGWPAGEARVELRLTPADGPPGGCRIVMREDITHGPGRLVPGFVRRVALVPRNRESLKRLAYLAERPRP